MKLTKSINKSEVKRDWVIIDAEGKVFGRIITEVATLLRGKHKPYFTPHVDCGDSVIIIIIRKAKFTGTNKLEDKQYHRHSGYFGSVKSEKLGDLLINNPEKLYNLAARGMLPKNKLARGMLKRLKVYTTDTHPHTAQVKA